MLTVRTSAGACALLLALSATSSAQSLEEKLQEKLGKPFAKNVPWVLGFGDAKKQAAEKGKVIFAYFSRSYSP
jgi:hypothetical protein